MFSTEIYTIPFMFPLYHTESTVRLLLAVLTCTEITLYFSSEQTDCDISAGVIREVLGESVVIVLVLLSEVKDSTILILYSQIEKAHHLIEDIVISLSNATAKFVICRISNHEINARIDCEYKDVPSEYKIPFPLH